MGGKGEQKNGPENGSNIMLTLATIGDTTWRLFVPSIGLLLLGLWGDAHFGSKPWLMLAGLVLGVAIAIYLVKMQLDTKV